MPLGAFGEPVSGTHSAPKCQGAEDAVSKLQQITHVRCTRSALLAFVPTYLV